MIRLFNYLNMYQQGPSGVRTNISSNTFNYSGPHIPSVHLNDGLFIQLSFLTSDRSPHFPPRSSYKLLQWRTPITL